MGAWHVNAQQRLRGLLNLLNAASKVALEELEKEESTSQTSASTLPSRDLYEAERTIVGACGALSALMQRPDVYLITVCGEFHEARALQIAVEHGVADHLATAGTEGMHIEDLSSRTGVAAAKLERVIRTLCSIHIFDEVQEHRFSNSTISTELVGNPELCALLVHLLREKEVFPASERFPTVLSDPVKGPSTDVAHAAFPEYIGRPTSIWDWLEEGIPQPDGSIKPNPALERIATAMVGWGRTSAGPLYQEYPWDALGEATIVDVGGGEGGLCLDLSKLYPRLDFVVQDRGPVIAHADDFWESKAPEALNRVKFMPHDFFLENPIKGAGVYVLRHVIHDWEDARSIDILTAIRKSMAPNSRLLVADHVLNTTLGHPELASAPAPLPANYGAWSRFGHILDLDMMVVVNGIERTPAQFRELASHAGLEIVKIWECRGHAQIVELRLPGAT